MIGGLIVAMGIVAMVMIHEGGHFLAAKAVGMKATEFFFGFGPKLWSFRRGETEYGVKALPFGGYVRITGMNPYEEVAPADLGRTYREKPFWAKTVVVLAGIVSHFVVAYLIFFAIFAVVGVHDPDRPLPVVARVVAETEELGATPASRVDLRPGDRLLAIDGRPVSSWEEVRELIAGRPGGEVTLLVERDGRELRLQTELAAVEDPGTGRTVGFLGVGPEFAVTRLSPPAAAARAGGALVETTRRAAIGLGRLVQPDTLGSYLVAMLQGSTVPTDIRPTSPVGLVRVGAEAQQLGLEVVLGLLAAVNVFVGLFNLVPLYPLDGGHFAVALFEKVTGREVDVRRLMPLAAAVIAFFILLGIVAIYFDIVSPVPEL